MILFEVKESRDFDLLGPWNFGKNTVTIGGLRSQLSNLKINNEDFKKEVAQITVHKNKLFVEIFDESTTIFINGKKTVGRALLKKGDQLQTGHTLLEIKDYSYSEQNFNEELSENLKKIIRGNHPTNAIIKTLERYIRN